MTSTSRVAPGEPSEFLDLGEDVVVERDVRVEMRDGIGVYVDVYRPAGEHGPLPCLYAVSPYQKDTVHFPIWSTYRTRETGDIAWWVRNGYAYVHADVRGSGKSLEDSFSFLGLKEQTDLADTIEWIAAQDWCTGKVGMIGESYYAMLQWLAAAQQPSALACIAPFDATFDVFRDFSYHGGIFNVGFMSAWWSLSLSGNNILGAPEELRSKVMTFDVLAESFRHPTEDAFWQERSAFRKLAQIRTPFFVFANWPMLGVHLRGSLQAFEEIDAPKKLRICTGVNMHSSLANFLRLHPELLRWYDYWLKGVDNGIMDEPAVHVERRQGGGTESYRAWPPPVTEPVALELAGGRAGVTPSLNDGVLTLAGLDDPAADDSPATSYTYPNKTWHGYVGLGIAAMTPRGPDPYANLCTFTTAPLVTPIRMIGQPVATIYLSSDQSDADVYLKLLDLDEEGRLACPTDGISRGWLRASHRALDETWSRPHRPFHPHDRVEPLEPGDVYELAVEMWPGEWEFAPGHRIQLLVAPADSPVDSTFTHFFGRRAGTDTLHHAPGRPSRVLLPVVTAGPPTA